MQQYVVPQFIDVEDKIIGPITTRQFLILLVGGLLIFLEYKLSFTIISFAVKAFFTVVLVGGIAFVKFNGMPMHYFLLNIAQNLFRPKIRVWQRTSETVKVSDADDALVSSAPVVAAHSSLSQSRLQHLTLMIDTGGAYQPEADEIELNNKK